MSRTPCSMERLGLAHGALPDGGLRCWGWLWWPSWGQGRFPDRLPTSPVVYSSASSLQIIPCSWARLEKSLPPSLHEKRASLSRAQPSNLISSLGAGPIATASFHSQCAAGYLVFFLQAVGFLFSSNQVHHYPGRELCASVFWLHHLSVQTISGENKTKPAVREEGKKLVKLFCWYKWDLRANPKQDCGGVSEKKTCYQFLRGFITGIGMLGVLFTEKMPIGHELWYTQPWTCTLEWINSELQSERKAYHIYIVSSLCPWKCSSQHCGLVGSTDFSEDILMQTNWEQAASLATREMLVPWWSKCYLSFSSYNQI